MLLMLPPKFQARTLTDRLCLEDRDQLPCSRQQDLTLFVDRLHINVFDLFEQSKDCFIDQVSFSKMPSCQVTMAFAVLCALN